MTGFKIPLNFSNGNIFKNNIYNEEDRLNEEQKLKSSIENFIKLLLNSPNGSFKPDYDFGFPLNNFKFENVGNATGAGFTINDKKIKDYSIDLQRAISKFEPRLHDICITIELNREKTEVKAIVKAKYLNNNDFNKVLTFYIWKKNENTGTVL